MKKIIFSLIVFISFTQFSYSQIVWSPAGATWHYVINWFADQGYAEIKYVSDTVVVGIPCKKLIEHQRYRSVTGGPEINNFRNLFTYDSSNIVFIYNLVQGSNNWDTLINFNIVPGGFWYFSNSDTVRTEVLDTGSGFVNGLNLEWIYVKNHQGGFTTFDTIYNRVGYANTFYPFDPLGSLSSDPLVYGFCNYYDSTFAIYGNPDSTCTILPNGISNPKTVSEISIYPNPATNEIKISNLSQLENQIKIFNLLCQQVKSIEVNNEQNTTINISDLSFGIYELTIF